MTGGENKSMCKQEAGEREELLRSKKGGLNMMIAREGDGERDGEQVEIEWLKRAGAR